MIRTQIQLTEQQARAVKAAASKRGTSIAEVIREALDRHLALSATHDHRRQKAIASVGGFRSGHVDVSEKHDEHLSKVLDE